MNTIIDTLVVFFWIGLAFSLTMGAIGAAYDFFKKK